MTEPEKPQRGAGEGAPGDPGLSTGALFPQVYARLRAVAQRHMSGERSAHTLQATALVNEAYLRLAGSGVAWQGKGQFYIAAAEAMRHVLIDHARRRGAAKRGAGRAALDVSSLLDVAVEENLDGIVALDAAIVRLQEHAPEAAAVVRLRFYAGLSVDGTAAALGVSARTVNREWTFARAWLARELAGEGSGGDADDRG